MQKLKILGADVYLENFEFGKGKIIITNGYDNYSYGWGAMGSTLEDFILSINSSYFINAVCPHSLMSVFDAKRTATAIRKRIAEFLPYWKHMPFQKEMRLEIKKVEECSSQNDFEYWARNFESNLPFYEIDCRFDRQDLESEFEGLMCEWWYMMETKDSPQVLFLARLFKELQRELKKQSKLKAIAA